MAYNMSGGGKRRGWGAATGGNRANPQGPNNYFALGQWKFQCDECARIFHSPDAGLRWDNCYVCWQCMEIRNPQDFVRGVPDKQSIPWSRPRPPPTFASGSATGASGGAYSIDGSSTGVGRPEVD